MLILPSRRNGATCSFLVKRKRNTGKSNLTGQLDFNMSGKEVAKALYGRNHEMVNDSEICIALYPDDHWDTSKGGTAECIRFAKKKNLNFIR